MINVYLTDDHTLLAEGLTTALAQSEDIRITRTFSTLHDCSAALATEQPDILLMDISMPDGDGVAFCHELVQEYPALHIIALTMHDEYSLVKRVLDTGIAGYVLKNVTTDELAEAIRRVHDGKKYICAEIASLMRKRATTEVTLTERETEILKLLAEGYNSRRIAEILFISEKTVKWHRKNLLNKLGASNTSELIAIVIKKKLV